MSRWILVGLIVAAGLTLRLYHLGFQDIWHDEAFSLSASHQSFGPMTKDIVHDFVHPPLHYYLLHVWMRLIGFGIYQGRLLSVLFGVAAIGMTYLLAEYSFDWRTGWLAAFMLAVSQYGVRYSQEVRPYEMAVFLAAAATYFFARALRERSARWWWSFVAAATLAAYTHYYTLCVVLTLAAFGLANRRRYRLPWSWWASGTAAASLCFVPWLMSGVVQVSLQSPKRTLGFTNPNMSFTFGRLVAAINTFDNGKVLGVNTPTPAWAVLMGALLFLVPAGLALLPLVRRQRADAEAARDGLWMMGLTVVVPILAIVGMSVRAGFQFAPWYLQFSMVPYYILAARGILGLRTAVLRGAAIVALAAFSGPALWAHYTIPFKGAYREAVAYMVAEFREGDACVNVNVRRLDSGPYRQWFVYQPGRPYVPSMTLDAVAAGRTSCRRLWLVFDYYPGLYPDRRFQREAQRRLESRWKLVSEHPYYGLEISLYKNR